MAIIKSGGNRHRMIDRARKMLPEKKRAVNMASMGGSGGSAARTSGGGGNRGGGAGRGR